MMGSPENEPERESWKAGTETPQHEVRIAKPFAVGRYPITRGEWARFVKATGHKTEGGCYEGRGKRTRVPRGGRRASSRTIAIRPCA